MPSLMGGGASRTIGRRGGVGQFDSMSRLLNLLLIGLFLLLSVELIRHNADANNVHRRFYRRAVRLCSNNLSDALYLLCKDRGYNEPFSNSGESVVRYTGPGLVQECCYNSCTLEQMEQYCKPKGEQ